MTEVIVFVEDKLVSGNSEELAINGAATASQTVENKLVDIDEYVLML